MQSINAALALPIELIENIISDLWSSSLSMDDRISFMLASPLVSRGWALAFMRMSSKDIHIPCASYADKLLSILRGESRIYNAHPKLLPQTFCESLTFKVERDSDDIYAVPESVANDRKSMARTLSNTLYSISTLGYLPNLSKVSIEYVNWGYEDIFDNFRLVTFPSQVTELELAYTFGEATPKWVVNGLRRAHQRDPSLPWWLRSVKTLTVLGAGTSLVMNMLVACTGLETLVVDGTLDGTVNLEEISDLPANVRELDLCAPSTPPASEGFDVGAGLGNPTSLGMQPMQKTIANVESGSSEGLMRQIWEQLGGSCDVGLLQRMLI